MKRLLYLGCTPGNDVKLLQNDLNAVAALPGQKSACAPLGADGAFGQKSLSRVLEFQQLNGLEADGVVGPATRGTLEALLVQAPGAQAPQVGGGSSPGSGKGYEGGPPYGKPMPDSGKGSSSSYGKGGGGKSAGGGSGAKGYGGKGYGGKDYGGKGSGGGKGW